jgi:hypothetical protein
VQRLENAPITRSEVIDTDLHGKTKEFQQVFARPSFNAETSHESLVYRRYRLAMLTVMKGIGYVSAEIL